MIVNLVAVKVCWYQFSWEEKGKSQEKFWKRPKKEILKKEEKISLLKSVSSPKLGYVLKMRRI